MGIRRPSLLLEYLTPSRKYLDTAAFSKDRNISRPWKIRLLSRLIKSFFKLSNTFLSTVLGRFFFGFTFCFIGFFLIAGNISIKCFSSRIRTWFNFSAFFCNCLSTFFPFTIRLTLLSISWTTSPPNFSILLITSSVSLFFRSPLNNIFTCANVFPLAGSPSGYSSVK